MSIIDRLRSFFLPPLPAEVAKSEVVDEIFQHLIGLVRDSTALAPHIERIRAAMASRDAARDAALLKAYFELEQFIVTSRPPTVERSFTTETLREEVGKIFESGELTGPFRLLFLKPDEQLKEIYQYGIGDALKFLVDYIGAERVSESLKKAVHGTPFEGAVKDTTIDFSAAQGKPSEQVFEAYRRVYKGIFDEIRIAFGESKALDISRRDYEFFKETYDASITSRYLSLLPEGVLELERLAFMSREELEGKIAERTRQLSELNDELEEKVRARTKELTEANARLKEADEVKSEFISVAAHQLRTPLTGIKWALSTVLSESPALAPDQKQILERSVDASDFVIHLVDEMLDITRIETRGYEIAPTKQPIQPLLQEIFEMQKHIALAKKVQLTLVLPEAPLPELSFDRDKMTIVLDNLIDNAIKYTPEGGSVEISASLEDTTLTIRVKDSGIGIPAATAGRVFTKFYRADNAVHAHPDGTGLGLYVAHKIVELHHSTLRFESVENAGTTFSFSLPLAG